MIVQKIKKTLPQMDVAMSYYSIICTINKIHITNRQLQLLAFTAIKGSITNPAARKEFCELFSTSQATINNMIGELKEMRLLTKLDGKIKVTPALQLDFTEPITMQITLLYGGTTT